MTRSSASLLQAVVVLIGLAALAFLLFEPHVEGRNARATLFQIYFNDPFLAYVYFGSIPFFAGLVQAFRALGHAGQHGAVSPETINALRTIRRCMIATIGFAAVGEVIIFLNESDDRAGGVVIGLVIILGLAGVATAAAMLERAGRRRLGPD